MFCINIFGWTFVELWLGFGFLQIHQNSNVLCYLGLLCFPIWLQQCSVTNNNTSARFEFNSVRDPHVKMMKRNHDEKCVYVTKIFSKNSPWLFQCHNQSKAGGDKGQTQDRDHISTTEKILGSLITVIFSCFWLLLPLLSSHSFSGTFLPWFNYTSWPL